MDRDHYSGFRPPDDFDTVVHQITVMLTWWTQLEHEGIPCEKLTDLIDYLTDEPLVRATKAPAMHKEFDALGDNFQVLLELHRKLQRKNLSVQGIVQSINAWTQGPLTSAVVVTPSTPNLVQFVDITVDDAATADASIGFIQPSSALPVTTLPQFIGETPNNAATADASTGAFQPSPARPAIILPQSLGKTPKNAATADASIGAFQSSLALPATTLSQSLGKIPKNAATADALTEVIQPFPAIPAMNPPQTMGKDPVKRELSEPLETHFDELCPINLLGSKCKCDLLKVNLKDPSVYKEKPWLQPTCRAFLEDNCTGEDCNKAHNFLVERRRMASESRLQDHHAYMLECKASSRNKQKA